MRNGLTILMVVVAIAACGDGLATQAQEQAIAGPSGVMVTARAADQLAVSWTATAGASSYLVFQAQNGGPSTLVATVFDSQGGLPPTSYIADALMPGASYCFAVVAEATDGSQSDPTVGCSGVAPAPSTVTITLPIPASSARASASPPAATLQGVTGWLVTGTGELAYQLPVQVGDVIIGFRVWGNKQSSTATRLAATVMAVRSSNGVASGGMTASNQTSSPGPFVLQPPAGAVPVQAGFSYIIEADSTTGIQQDIWLDAEVTVSRMR